MNFNSGFANMVSHLRVSAEPEKDSMFIERKGQLGKKSPWFFLAEPLPGKKRSLSSSRLALLQSQGVRTWLSAANMNTPPYHSPSDLTLPYSTHFLTHQHALILGSAFTISRKPSLNSPSLTSQVSLPPPQPTLLRA